jgi:hypothetical protein
MNLFLSIYLAISVFLGSIGLKVNHHYCSKEDKHFYSFFENSSDECEDEKSDNENESSNEIADCCKFLEELTSNTSGGCCSDFSVKTNFKEITQIQKVVSSVSPCIITLFWVKNSINAPLHVFARFSNFNIYNFGPPDLTFPELSVLSIFRI